MVTPKKPRDRRFAENERFELSGPLSETDTLAGCYLKPLRQFSAKRPIRFAFSTSTTGAAYRARTGVRGLNRMCWVPLSYHVLEVRIAVLTLSLTLHFSLPSGDVVTADLSGASPALRLWLSPCD